jgi:hypothetical protein
MNQSQNGFEVLTAVKLSMLALWVVTPCCLVGRYQRFGETSPHGVTTQKTNIDIIEMLVC